MIMPACVRRSLRAILGVPLAFLLILTSGCDEVSPIRDSDIDLLQSLAANPSMPADAKERAQTALTRYDDDVSDPTPFLVYARIETAPGEEEPTLAFLVLDEDDDLLGFGLLEESYEPNGTVEEEYPVFAHFRLESILTWYDFPVHVRDANQNKDATLWNDYLAMDFNDALRKAIDDGKVLVEPSVVTPTEPAVWRAKYAFWEMSLPPAWVSVPAADHVDVSIYVYDRAGHKSNAVELFVPGNRGTAYAFPDRD